jgi:hypothetical protein
MQATATPRRTERVGLDSADAGHYRRRAALFEKRL